MLDVIKSMYESVRSRIRYQNVLSDDFTCMLDAPPQGESLSPFLFAMYLNDIEDYFVLNGFEGIDLCFFKKCFYF